MVEEIATVVQTDAQGVWLETRVQSSCQACSANDSCTSGVVAKHLTNRQYRFFLPYPPELQHKELLPGQQVRIGLHEGVLLKSALVVYLLPLLLFIAAVFLMFWAEAGEGWQLCAGIVAALPGYYLARRFGVQQGGAEQQVELLAVLPTLAVQQQ
ncbi:SoxR reducing system RseC family protein [Rheinheimera sp. 4Y26]|uniref:SoxR reducing system RseC family protein n=1 Tax=Rheinheimera sp. 4Y26 TaxID=2977811 RepID=UPI0021B0B6E8|nr:SoxR reducing system RseC family protein [Rheinheimera sp. 4Y26]MCT6698985.1 SoxR reducing system RseC family protein [Rheinheimera sp. 4Y26]